MPWVKGISGNPGGRRREKAYTEALRMVGAEEVDHPEDPTKKVRKFRLLAEIVFKRALEGESWAVQHIADRLEGKPAQMPEERADPGGQPMRRLVREFVHVVETREEFERKELGLIEDRVKLINGNGNGNGEDHHQE